MSKTILLNIQVDDEELEGLTKKLDQTGAAYEVVDDSADKATKSTSKFFGEIKKSNPIVAELNKRTGGLVNKIFDLRDAAKKAGVSMRIAMSATVIGALVVAVGLVVAYWDDIKGFITGANLELERQIAIQEKLVEQQQHALDLLNASDNILKLQGKTQKEINALKQEEIKKLIEIQTKELELQKTRLQSLKDIQKGGVKGLEGFFRISTTILTSFAQSVDDMFAKIGITTAIAGTVFSGTDSIIESIFGSREDISETEDRIKELEKSLISLQNTAAGLTLSEIVRGPRAKEESIFDDGDLSTNFEGQLERLTNDAEMLLDFESGVADARIALTEDAERAKTDAERRSARSRMEIAKLEAQAKIESAMGYAQALSGISSLIGRETVAGKSLAVASAGISTYLSAQQAYQSQLSIPTPDAPIRAALAAAGAVAAGLANIKRIISVKVPSFGGGGGGASFAGGNSFGSGAIPSPEFNVVGNTGINQLQGVIENGLTKPVRAYVLNGDVRKANEIENNSIQEATV